MNHNNKNGTNADLCQCQHGNPQRPCRCGQNKEQQRPQNDHQRAENNQRPHDKERSNNNTDNDRC